MARYNPGTPRQKRHARVRAKVRGVATRPRLCVYRSLSHIYAQIIDDDQGHTLVAASTVSPEIKADMNGKNKSSHAAWWPSAPWRRASARWSSTAAAINTTAG
jgi:ribosomal protein L18